MKTPPHTLALNRVKSLIDRYEALPYEIVEHNSAAMIEWDEQIDNLYMVIRDTGKVTVQQLENIKRSEAAMDHWELTAGKDPMKGE